VKALWTDGYRPFFLLFAVWGSAFLALWAHALSGGAPIPVADHAAVLLWGVLGSAVTGFLLTAFPRQNQGRVPSPRVIGGFLLLQVVTQSALAASWLGAPTASLATAAGIGLWAALLAWSVPIAVPSLRRAWDGATLAVPLALATLLVGWIILRTGDLRTGVDLGLHALLFLAASLLDRLVPFFSSRVVPEWDGVRRRGFVPLLLAAIALRFAWPPADLLVAAVLLRQWHGWRPARAVRVPLLAVLHLGFAWMVAGYLAGPLGLPRTLVVHVWGVGALVTLVMGLGLRVTLGHANQPLRLDARGVAVLVLVQLAVAFRVIIPLLAPGALAWCLPVAGLVLATAFAGWALRYAPLLVR
jgi:uncharacterized protein involved in response to NO